MKLRRKKEREREYLCVIALEERAVPKIHFNLKLDTQHSILYCNFWPILVFKCGTQFRDHESYHNHITSLVDQWWNNSSGSHKNSLAEQLEWALTQTQCCAFFFHVPWFLCVIVSISICKFAYFCFKLHRIVLHRFDFDVGHSSKLWIVLWQRLWCCSHSKEFQKWILLAVHI